MSAQENNPKVSYRLSEASAATGIPVKSLRKFGKAGDLKLTKAGPRTILILAEDLSAFLAAKRASS